MNSALSTGASRLLKEGQTGGGKPLPPRPSLAPPGTATANRVPPASRMASGAAGPVQRRSSAYGKGGTGLKADPRPVSDKAYQQACIRTIIAYLTTHDYDHPISAKVLHRFALRALRGVAAPHNVVGVWELGAPPDPWAPIRPQSTSLAVVLAGRLQY